MNIQNNIQKDINTLEKDDFNEFVTHSALPDIDDYETQNEIITSNYTSENNNFECEPIPTTDTGEFPFDIVG